MENEEKSNNLEFDTWYQIHTSVHLLCSSIRREIEKIERKNINLHTSCRHHRQTFQTKL